MATTLSLFLEASTFQRTNQLLIVHDGDVLFGGLGTTAHRVWPFDTGRTLRV